MRTMDLEWIKRLKSILDKSTQEDLVCDSIDGKNFVFYEKESGEQVIVAEHFPNGYDVAFFMLFRQAAPQLLELSEQAIKGKDTSSIPGESNGIELSNEEIENVFDNLVIERNPNKTAKGYLESKGWTYLETKKGQKNGYAYSLYRDPEKAEVFTTGNAIEIQKERDKSLKKKKTNKIKFTGGTAL